MSKEEYNLQCQIITLLRYNHIFCFAIPNGEKREQKTVFSKKRGGYIKYSPTGVKLKAQGVLAGVSDIQILLPSRCIFIELKSLKGTQKDSQIEFEKNVKALGFEYYLWNKLEDAQAFVKEIKK